MNRRDHCMDLMSAVPQTADDLLQRVSHQLWANSGFSRFFYSVTAFSIAWPFFAAACLVIALALLPGTSVQKAWGLPLYASFAIPITIYALLLVSRDVMTDQIRTRSE